MSAIKFSVIGGPVREDFFAVSYDAIPAVEIIPVDSLLKGSLVLCRIGRLNWIEPFANSKGQFVWIAFGAWIIRVSEWRIFDPIWSDFNAVPNAVPLHGPTRHTGTK